MSKVAHLKDFWHISGFRTKFIYILTKTLILRKCQCREKSARSRFFVPMNGPVLDPKWTVIGVGQSWRSFVILRTVHFGFKPYNYIIYQYVSPFLPPFSLIFIIFWSKITLSRSISFCLSRLTRLWREPRFPSRLKCGCAGGCRVSTKKYWIKTKMIWMSWKILKFFKIWSNFDLLVILSYFGTCWFDRLDTAAVMSIIMSVPFELISFNDIFQSSLSLSTTFLPS